MSEVMRGEGSADVRIWAPIQEVEAQALQQLKSIARLPWVFHHVAVMPDVHFGIGATVGSVIAMKDAVSPAAVGVDIGCGMAAVLTNLNARDLPDSLTEVRSATEKAIPVGFNWHKEAVDPGGDLGLRAQELYAQFTCLAPDVQGMKLGKGGVATNVSIRTQAFQQLGTLGGGNHFIATPPTHPPHRARRRSGKGGSERGARVRRRGRGELNDDRTTRQGRPPTGGEMSRRYRGPLTEAHGASKPLKGGLTR